jgi:hypothetical protein
VHTGATALEIMLLVVFTTTVIVSLYAVVARTVAQWRGQPGG